MQQYSTLIFIALLLAALYFLILRPQRKRQQVQLQTMNALSPGSRVMLASGVFGTVVSVGPRQVVLEISPGAELTVLKQAITKVVTEDDEDRLEEEDELEPAEEKSSAASQVARKVRSWVAAYAPDREALGFASLSLAVALLATAIAVVGLIAAVFH